MAIYHCSIQIFSRGKGRPTVAAAAYRAGEQITNERDGTSHDYTRKKGIVHTEIILPDHAPSEYKDRSTLWNAVEKIEKAKNSQLAREIEIALPRELSLLENKSLVRRYVKENFVAKGMCADFAIHDKGDGNPHAHIMLTMRPINEDGTWGAKSKKEYIVDKNGNKIRLKSGEWKSRKVPANDWNEQTKAEEWREAWANIANRYLEKLNHADRIDHRSYERQGVDRIPTVHLGVAASQMEQRGIKTDLGNRNREILTANQAIRRMQARIKRLEKWIEEAIKNPTPPTFANIIEMRLDGTIVGLKAAARILRDAQENKVVTIADLKAKVEEISEANREIKEKLKPINRRLGTLEKHIENAQNYNKYLPIWKEYYNIKRPKTKKEFAEKHSTEITSYKAAVDYLKPLLQGKPIPLKEWKAEQATKIIERDELESQITPIFDMLCEIEAMRRSAKAMEQARNRNRSAGRDEDER